MKVLYEDNHLLAVEKPVNMPVQADASGDMDLLTLAKAYIKEKYNKPGDVYLGLVHRLDRPVGGAIVFARTSKAAARLSDAFRTRAVTKRYAAIVSGAPPAYARLDSHIKKDGATGSALIVPPGTEGAKAASLEYRRSIGAGGLTLLDVNLFTGRHHQIRAQLSDAGFPIWGDQRYAPSAVPGQQIALWAYRVSFPHPTKGETVTLTSLPAGGAWTPFEAALRCLGAGVRLAYADGDILAVSKERGMSVALADGGDSLEERLHKADIGEIYPVHRLDVATKGLVLFARSAAARDALIEAIAARQIRKIYRCTVWGDFPSGRAELKNYLLKDAAAAKVEVYDAPRPGAKEAVTLIRVLGRERGKSELEAELVTGRTHQIRAQLAHAGYPIVGDDRYGERALERAAGGGELMLCAVRIAFALPKGSPLARLNGTEISETDAR